MVQPTTLPLLITVLLGAIAAAPAAAQVVGSDSVAGSEIRTSATAERSVRPDRATVTLSFAAAGRTPAIAGEAVAARADSLRDALVALGIPRDSLVTAGRYNYWRGRIEVVRGSRLEPVPDSILRMRWGDRPIPRPQTRSVPDTTYRAHDAIEVRIRDLTLVGRVIDIALAHGVTRLSNVRYQATNTTAAEEAALREATERARQRAGLIARASGGELGRTLLLSTRQETPYGRYGLDEIVVAGMTGSGASAAETEVVEPRVRVRATVYGRWQYVER